MLIKMMWLCLLACTMHCTALIATDYYVSNNGDDNNNGLSETSAWKTIAKVNATTFSPGDHILFEKGGTWREELVITNSGTAGNFIVYASYGSGAKPQILGSSKADAWSEVATNIWQSTEEFDAPRQRTGHSVTNHPASIFFVGNDGSVTWGNMEEIHLNNEGAPTDICERNRDNGFSLMDREFDWCWGDNHIYIYSTENPATRYAYVEIPQRMTTIKMNSNAPQQYVEIDGLELLYAVKHGFDGGWPMNQQVRGLNVKNCHIAYMGTKGAASAMGLQIWHSDMLVQNNKIHDCGRRNISYNVYGDVRSSSLVFENVVFENNELYHGSHTTGFDINAGYNDEFRNFTFRNNYIWDDPNDDPQNNPNDFASMGMFLNSGSGTFNNFKVYNNVFRYIKQKHIAAGVLNNSFISFNTFYGMNLRAGGSYRGMLTVSGQQSGLTISNNIFYGNVENEYVLSGITLANNSHIGASLNYNLYFQEHDNQRMVTIDGTGSSYKISQWNEYLADTGWDGDSPAPSDPLFSNAPSDLTLTENSPARNAGATMAEVTTDLLGNARATQPSIGAYEYGSQVSTFEELGAEKVKIYPNPSNGQVFIDLDTKEMIKFSVYNINAQLLRSEEINKPVWIDLKVGIYFIKLDGKGMKLTRKVIVK